MKIKKLIRRIAKFIVFEQPNERVTVQVAQINYGSILKGRNIVITGGGSGIGLAMAKKFASEGANVIISGRNEEKLKKAVEEIGTNAQYAQFDVTDVNNDRTFLEKCKTMFNGAIDCLVSNAGLSLHENVFTNVTIDGFDKQFNTNMRGNYFLCKAFLEMKLPEKAENASLLITTSETGDQAYDIPYGMTKAALNSMVKALSRRVYKSGIRVNAIAPGVTLSEMTSSYASAEDGNLYRDCASGRTFLPEEVAEVACFLLSDASKCISGEIIHTNAGNHLNPFWKEV